MGRSCRLLMPNRVDPCNSFVDLRLFVYGACCAVLLLLLLCRNKRVEAALPLERPNFGFACLVRVLPVCRAALVLPLN